MNIEIGDHQDRLCVAHKAMRSVAKAAFSGRSVDYDAVNVVLVSDAEIRRLNAQYRGLDRATDVLSFDLRPGSPPGMPRAGEIFVSTASTVRQARAHQVPVAEELARLVIHGLLHLQGFDHQRAVDRREMRRQEAAIFDAARPHMDELVGEERVEAAEGV